MEIPLGLLICGGIVVIVILGILLFALAFGYFLFERVVEYVIGFVGLALAAWLIISFVRIPIHLPFLAPANTPAPLGTPALERSEIERALSKSGANIELLHFELTSGNIAKIEFKFDSTLLTPDKKQTEAEAYRLICAVRTQRREAVPHDLHLVAQSRHKNQVFGFWYTRDSGEIKISANTANRINCSG